MRLAQFSSGAHAEVYKALKRLQKRGAKAFVLDLRGNGGGLVNEAQLVASAFLSDGPIVTTRGRTVPSQTLNATGDAIFPKGPLGVLVDKGTASASEIVTGALQDRNRATVVGTHTFGKGVFQEVLDLSNGGALDITAGQYFTPKGRNLGGRGVKTGAGIAPDVKASDDPKTAADEGLDRAPRASLGSRSARLAARARARAASSQLAQRGRFLTGEPFFEPRAPGHRRSALRRAPRAPGAAARAAARAGARRSTASSGAPTSRATCSRR